MQPFGDTRTDTRPVYVDDGDERAARRTLLFLGVALFVAVVGATLVLSLMALDDDPRPVRADTAGRGGPVETVTTLPPPMEVGPQPGTEVAGYITGRKSALAGVRDEREAVVSLAKYSTQAQ
ncbi:MAG: hypothetical protein M3326_16825, partial [Actinomycetota bacterium]|nr:hypothetical protein [Actinomycetota bacterium]